jgi:hypothetical protein
MNRKVKIYIYIYHIMSETKQRTIDKIKVYGERSSGITFLTRLSFCNFVCKTIICIPECENEKTIIEGWKHGEPDINLYGDNDNILYFIIFRKLEPWLKSFFYYQWHVKKITNFEDFLTTKQSVGGYLEYDKHTSKCTNISDDGKDIFEIRYHKCSALLDFFEKVPNIVQVNLDYLQNNTQHFINTISKVFDVNTGNTFDSIPNHTKCKGPIKNTEYPIVITDEISKIISSKRNNDLEKRMDMKLIIKKNNVIIDSIC